jgi:hypothetical protein
MQTLSEVGSMLLAGWTCAIIAASLKSSFYVALYLYKMKQTDLNDSN